MARNALVEHERKCVNLPTEGQTSDQMWWLLRTYGITSTSLSVLVTLAHTKARPLFAEDPGVRALLRLAGINFDNARHSELDEHSSLPAPDNASLSEYIRNIARESADLKKLSRPELCQICKFYAIISKESKDVLASRLWSLANQEDDITPLSSMEQVRNSVVAAMDAHLFHEPFKGTEYTTSGLANETNLLKS